MRRRATLQPIERQTILCETAVAGSATIPSLAQHERVL